MTVAVADRLSTIETANGVATLNGNAKWTVQVPPVEKEDPVSVDKAAEVIIGFCRDVSIDHGDKENVVKMLRKALWLEAIRTPNNNIAASANEKESAVQNDNSPPKRPSKAKMALEIAMASCVETFADDHGRPYAAIQVREHVEVLPIKGGRFRTWICRLYYEAKGDTLSSEDVSNVVNVLAAEAEFGGGERKMMQLRVGYTNPGGGQQCLSDELHFTIYYDLTNEKWEVVRITPKGWSIVPAPLFFTRYSNQLAQAYPAKSYRKDVFDRFIDLTNVKTEDHKLLLKVYIVTLFIPDIPKPVLMLHGEHGSAKSTLQELIKMLVDPSSVRLLSFPRDINELIQKLSHNYVAYFDNISHIREWVSDELCKAVTGSGFSKRQLYTDDDDITYSFRRCIGFNGINLAATKSDLLDRGLIIQLARIPKKKRCKIAQIWDEFGEIRPELLAYVFDILVKVLQIRKQGGVQLGEHPRMADFAEWGEMVARAMGCSPGEFLAAYYRNIGLQTEEAIEANPVAACVRKFMIDKEAWQGSATELLERLDQVAITDFRIDTKSKVSPWPKSANALSRKLNEVTPNLSEVGIVIERVSDTSRNITLVQIRKISPESPEPPEGGKQEQKTLDHAGDTQSAQSEPLATSPAGNQIQAGDRGDSGDEIPAVLGSEPALQCPCPYCHKTFGMIADLQTHGINVHPGRAITAAFYKQHPEYMEDGGGK